MTANAPITTSRNGESEFDFDEIAVRGLVDATRTASSLDRVQELTSAFENFVPQTVEVTTAPRLEPIIQPAALLEKYLSILPNIREDLRLFMSFEAVAPQQEFPTDTRLPGHVAEALAKAHRSPSGLEEALKELRELDAVSADDCFPPVSDQAKRNAERILREICRIFPRRFEIYPTEDAEVSILTSGARGSSVLILFDSEGGAACFVTMNGRNRRARYDDASDLPYAFIREALAELRP